MEGRVAIKKVAEVKSSYWWADDRNWTVVLFRPTSPDYKNCNDR